LDFLEKNRAYVHTQSNHQYQQQHQQQHQQHKQHTKERRGKGKEERDYWLGAAAVLAQFEGMKSTLLGVGNPITVLPFLTSTRPFPPSLPPPPSGLVAGYHASTTHIHHAPLSSLELYLLNAYGDIFDLSALFPPQPDVPPFRLGPWLGGRDGGREGDEEEEEEEEEGGWVAVWENRDNDRCSVLIKATEVRVVSLSLLIHFTTNKRFLVPSIHPPHTLPPSLSPSLPSSISGARRAHRAHHLRLLHCGMAPHYQRDSASLRVSE